MRRGMWSMVAVFLACGGGPSPAAPVEPASNWWVVESSQVDGIAVGTILRIEGTEFQTVDASNPRPVVDSRLVRAIQTDVWAMDGTPLTLSRNGRTLVFTSSDRPPRTLAVRPAQPNEVTLAAQNMAKHPSREVACEIMDACLEAMRADFQMKVEAMSHVSLEFCETTRIGIGGRYKAMRKTPPEACR